MVPARWLGRFVCRPKMWVYIQEFWAFAYNRVSEFRHKWHFLWTKKYQFWRNPKHWVLNATYLLCTTTSNSPHQLSLFSWHIAVTAVTIRFHFSNNCLTDCIISRLQYTQTQHWKQLTPLLSYRASLHFHTSSWNSRWQSPGGVLELRPNRKMIPQGSRTSVPRFIISPQSEIFYLN